MEYSLPLTTTNTFVREFQIGAADLSLLDVRNAYVVKSDVIPSDQEKTVKKVKSTKSIVIVDDLGLALKCGTNYTIEKVEAVSEGNLSYNVTLKAKGDYYTGTRTINAKGIDGYLYNCTIKMTGGSGKLKNLNYADIEALNNGKMTNKAFAEKYGLQVCGRIGDAAKAVIPQTDNNFNFVVTLNTKGGSAAIQAVGIDGGPLGGGDVLVKKQLTKKVTTD